MLRFEGAAEPLAAEARLRAAGGSIAAEPFMHGEAAFMWAAVPLILMRATPAVASISGGAAFTLAVAPWQAAEALPAEGAPRLAGAASDADSTPHT
jgi:hypothetical protein